MEESEIKRRIAKLLFDLKEAKMDYEMCASSLLDKLEKAEKILKGDHHEKLN